MSRQTGGPLPRPRRGHTTMQGKKKQSQGYHENGEFISSTFARPKSVGCFQLILNLPDNQADYKNFKVETISTITITITNTIVCFAL